MAPIPTRRRFAFLPLALLAPLPGDALDGVDDALSSKPSDHDRTTTPLLPRSRYSTLGYAAWSTKITGSSASTLCRDRMVSRDMPKVPSERNGLRMPGRPVHAGHEPAAVLRLVAEPAEGGLDDEGDAVIVIIGDLAVVEALHLAAGSRETRFEMLPPDNAEQRPALPGWSAPAWPRAACG